MGDWGLRVAALTAAGALLIGVLIGMRVHDVTPQQNLPPVQTVFYLELADYNPNRPTAEGSYARDLAAQFEARFLASPNSRYWPQDLRVTAQPVRCYPPTRGCGNVSRWAFQVRSAQALDPAAIGVALGPGQLTMRSVVFSNKSSCSHTALVWGGAPIAQPLIPESTAGPACLQLGPVIRKLARPSYVGSFSGDASTRMVLQLYIDDGAWLVAYSQTHLTPDIAVLLDEWIIGTVHPQVAVDHGLTAPTQPFALETNEVKTSMAAAISTAASTYQPWVLDPISAST